MPYIGESSGSHDVPDPSRAGNGTGSGVCGEWPVCSCAVAATQAITRTKNGMRTLTYKTHFHGSSRLSAVSFQKSKRHLKLRAESCQLRAAS
jgi:hypothetical protein